MSDLLVTADDLGVPDVVCGCGHAADFHPGGPHDTETGWHADWSQHLAGEHCPCRKTKDGVRLAHLDGVVRREVEKALNEVRDALMKPYPISAHGRVKDVLERRLGADWLNGSQR